MCQVKVFSQMGFKDVHPLIEAERFLSHYTFPHVVAIEVQQEIIMARNFKSIHEAMEIIARNRKRDSTLLFGVGSR